MSVSGWIESNARRIPDKAALVCGSEILSYKALAEQCEAVAHALTAAGVKRRDRVAWLGLNSPNMISLLVACARLGAIFTPLNWRLTPTEHQSMIDSCTPTIFIADDAMGNSAALPSLVRWSDFISAGPASSLHDAETHEDVGIPFLLYWTSGSTGRPKGVLLSQDAISANADASVEMHGLSEDDHILTTLPLFHVGGLNIQTLPALRAGCTVTLQARFDADATFDVIEKGRVSLTVLVPAQLEVMVVHPRWGTADLSSLRMISTGSTFVPEHIIKAVHALGIPLAQIWGATETAPIASCLRATDAMTHAGSAGRAALGCELRIIGPDGKDVPANISGEVLVRGRNLMLGYWQDPDASAAALAGGWYHSGDSGRIDSDGYLTIDGRLKDMIISGGENISPAEVEAALSQCPEIAEVAVIGRADARWGEVVLAVVVPVSGASPTPESLRGFLDGRLARFKQPADVMIVESLPRTALGKVRKDELRKQISGTKVP